MSRRIYRRNVMERTIRKQRRRLSHYVTFQAKAIVISREEE